MARGIWVFAPPRRAEFTVALLNAAAAVTQPDMPPYATSRARVPVSRDGQAGCG